jgi:hypothetical protein
VLNGQFNRLCAGFFIADISRNYVEIGVSDLALHFIEKFFVEIKRNNGDAIFEKSPHACCANS